MNEECRLVIVYVYTQTGVNTQVTSSKELTELEEKVNKQDGTKAYHPTMYFTHLPSQPTCVSFRIKGISTVWKN